MRITRMEAGAARMALVVRMRQRGRTTTPRGMMGAVPVGISGRVAVVGLVATILGVFEVEGDALRRVGTRDRHGRMFFGIF